MSRRLLLSISFLLVAASKLCGQNVIILPQPPATTYIVTSGQSVEIKASNSITLKPGVHFQAGSNVSVKIGNSLLIPAAPANPAADLTKNWVINRTYDEDGNEISAQKSFFDYEGNLLQVQSKNMSTGHVLASQPIYDLQGRPAVNTLPAPVNNSEFAYKPDFVTNTNNTVYDYRNFDYNISNEDRYAKTNNPDPVGQSQIGTLGWYYSNNNTFDTAVPDNQFPYTRTNFFRDGTGAVKNSAGVGADFKAGSGHETSSNSFPVISELDHYFAIRNKFFSESLIGTTPANLIQRALQSVSVDENGYKGLSVTDLSGKTLMTARADPNGWMNINNSFQVRNILPVYTFSTVPKAGEEGNVINKLSISSANEVEVTCLDCFTTPYIGTGNGYIFTNTGHKLYQVTSKYPFTATVTTFVSPLLNPIVTLYDDVSAQLIEPSSASEQYFQLVVPSAVSINGQYRLFDMSTESDISAGFTSGNTLQPGYYKVMAKVPAVKDEVNIVSVTYNSSYADISYNYYNQLGQLIASIAPNGVKELIDHPENYPASGPIPFATRYEYDLQGRLIASTSTDGGRSEFVYRRDGKIRFSQNAEQRKAANGGRFSYTNYDEVGRPIESGEYVPQSSTDFKFATTQSNEALLENTDLDGGLTGGQRQDWVRTHHDLPDASHGITGYVQDEGFLRGAVSWTENVKAKTWYNYDGQGRVVWTIKQINGLGSKTLNYVYDSRGNVIKVDYQRENPSERFLHHYTYDADGRLVNVQTSRNDADKLQHAKYYYYLHGPLKRTELGDNLQGLDYTYTAQGWLKSINHPSGTPANDPGLDGASNSFAPDAFGLQLEYFTNDYNRTGSSIAPVATGQTSYYNGNVSGLSWYSKKPQSVVSTDGAGIQAPSMYTYNYDPKYQLSSATWGTPDFSARTFTSQNKFKEYGLGYDPNGNIKTLQRTNAAGTISDNFDNYQYQPGTNKLTSVGSTAAPTGYASYNYDDLGQLKSAQQAGIPFGMYVKYDVTGKMTGIYANEALTQIKVGYAYDESGNRISRTDYTGSQPLTTYYIYDPSGNVLAIYNGSTISEAPIYGSDRLGTYTYAANSFVYELRDNVGSIRVVINRTKKNDGTVDVLTYNDYYPFGSVARNGGNGYRYEYQGAYAEKDAVTGWNNFDLRMYDGRIGRWLSVDPEGQFYSPYTGMGNNPVIGSDPTGGISPIYDLDGKFLGTDSKGLQGSAIIMDAKNFTQGMDHNKAMSLNLGFSALTKNTRLDVMSHFSKLRERPDYDGIVTIGEGIAWAKSHPNLGLNIKSQIYTKATADDYLYLNAYYFDFGSLRASDLKLGQTTSVNLFSHADLTSPSTWPTPYALGRTEITLLDPQGWVRVENGTWNNYDWDKGGGWLRNALIRGERFRAGINDTHGFPIRIYGTGLLNINK